MYVNMSKLSWDKTCPIYWFCKVDLLMGWNIDDRKLEYDTQLIAQFLILN